MHVATSTLALFVFDLPAAADIRVGLAAPLSGPMAPIGRAMRSTLEAAIREANTSGGLSDKRLTLVVADDACSGATAEQAAASLIQDRPALVIGHPCSGAATRAAALYRQAGVLLIAVDARHPDVTKGGAADPLVLRLAGRDDRQGDAAARWLIQHAPAGRVAIVHDRTAYARAIATRTKAILDAANVGSIVDLGIVAGKRDYPEIVTEIRAARAEAVFFAGFPDEAAIVAAGLAENGPTIPFLGTDSLATPGFADIARRTPNPIHVLLPSNPHALASGADAEGTPRPSSAAHITAPQPARRPRSKPGSRWQGAWAQQTRNPSAARFATRLSRRARWAFSASTKMGIWWGTRSYRRRQQPSVGCGNGSGLRGTERRGPSFTPRPGNKPAGPFVFKAWPAQWPTNNGQSRRQAKGLAAGEAFESGLPIEPGPRHAQRAAQSASRRSKWIEDQRPWDSIRHSRAKRRSMSVSGSGTC
ncbi:branched-chain amino acid ABC transporter substrate-binding protein [Hyphomicrobium nitrativorans]|nr:branched-chain amino acid ABC transporter substrate-binding protein [Hyphomicrobium nitrativorans]